MILHFWASLHDTAAAAAADITRRLAQHVRERYDFTEAHFPADLEACERRLYAPPSVRFQGSLARIALTGYVRAGEERASLVWTLAADLSEIAVSCVGLAGAGLAPPVVLPSNAQNYPRMAHALAARAVDALAWKLDVHEATWKP